MEFYCSMYVYKNVSSEQSSEIDKQYGGKSNSFELFTLFHLNIQ